MKEPRDILDEAIDALKSERGSANPPQETVDAVLQKLAGTDSESHIEEKITIAERMKAMNCSTKIAAAAVVVIAALIAVGVFTGPSEQRGAQIARQDISETEGVPETASEVEQAAERLEADLKAVTKMFAAGDVNALIAVLEEGQFQSKLAAAYFLAEIGDLRAVGALEKSNAAYGRDEPNNPFARAIWKIKSRLKQEKQKLQLAKAGQGEAQPEAKAEHKIRYSGLVTDTSGKAIEGVSVRSDLHREGLYPWSVSFKETEAKARTDRQGQFNLGLLSAIDKNKIRRILVFEHPEYATGWSDTARLDSNNLRIQLLESTVVAGKVIDENANPVENATVLATLQENSRYGYIGKDFYMAVSSGAEGRFVIENIFAGARLHIDVLKQGYSRYTSRDYGSDSYPVRGGEDDLIITLERGGAIKGRLVSEGKPYQKEGIVVEAWSTDGSVRGNAITDEKGQFEIIGLQSDRFTLMVNNKHLIGMGLTCRPLENIEVIDAAVSMAELKLQKGLQVSLQVLNDETGDAVSKHPFRITSNVENTLTLASGQTDAEGRRVVSFAPGEYVVHTKSWEDGRYREVSKKFDVNAEDEDLNLEIFITPRPMIFGQLVDAKGEPVQGYVWFGTRQVNTDEQGEFEVAEPEGEPDEIYTCHTFDMEKKLGRGFFWQRSDDVNDLEIVLEPLASIAGRMVDANGEGLAGVEPQLSVVLPDGSWCRERRKWWNTTLDDDGRFRIDGLPIGLVVAVNVSGQGDTGAVEVDRLKPGQTIDVNEIVVSDTMLKALREFKENEIEWNGTLSGQVIDENGEVLVGLGVSVSVGDRNFTDFTDIRGRYELTGLPEGKKVQLRIYGNGYGDTFDVVCDGNDFDVQIFPETFK